MPALTVLHYVTQWLWLSDSFVYGPISTSQHRPVVVSRMPAVNGHVYPPPPDFHVVQADGPVPAEGRPTAERVAELLGPLRPDLIHLHHGYCLPDATAIAELLAIPLVVSFWGYDVTALPGSDPARLNSYLTAPAAVQVPSRFLADRVVALGVEPARVRLMPAGVDTGFFAPAPLPAAATVGYVGRFVAKKGIDVLLAAWPAVRRAVPQAQLTLLGYGDLAPSGDPAAGIRVLAPDPTDPRGQVRELIRDCRVYVSPSKVGPDGDSESQHVGNLEAQASGRAVLTTDHGAIPEFVANGVTGVVVPQDDPAALAASLIDLLLDYDRCQRLARQSVLAAQRLDLRATAARQDQLYTELVAGHRAANGAGDNEIAQSPAITHQY